MQCPYCKNEMEVGYLKSSHFIQWGKEKRLGFLPQDIKLTKTGLETLFNGFFVKSYHCGACEKIVVSLDETERRSKKRQ